MKRQLQVIIAFAVLGVCVLTATATAGGVNLGVGEGNISIDLPGGTNLSPIEDLPACVNLRDDDGDGRTDLLDPGCSGAGDNDETDADAPTGDEPVDPGVEDPPTDGGNGSGGGGKGGQGGTYEPIPGGAGQGQGGGGKGQGQVEPKPDKDEVEDPDEPQGQPEVRDADGTPTNSNPTVTIADFGAAPVGVPNFVIDSFSIPPFLLPIYQACGTEYGIPWEVLASINRIETAFGTNLNVSSAGALGWMQFIPSSWQAYGVDANNDGRKDPYNPVDAICAAANYLKAAGGQDDIATAIFAYNHADWYVDEVLMYARQYGNIPDDLVGSLTGLTEGAHFPVAANSRYADDISEREAIARATPRKGQAGNVADVVSGSPTQRGINIYSRKGAPVVAVNDGVVKKIGKSKKLGRYLVLEDAYGNRFTYAELGAVAATYPVPKREKLSAKDFRLVSSDGEPTEPASAGSNAPRDAMHTEEKKAGDVARVAAAKAETQPKDSGPANTEDSRERLYAFPERDANVDRANLTGQIDELFGRRMPGYEGFRSYFSTVLRFDDRKMEMKRLDEGAKVVAGTVLGRIGKNDELAPHLHFEIRPTGRGAPKIDPKPILDGWKLLEATAIYRASGRNPFAESAAGESIGQILLASKEQLIKRVLNDPKLEIYSCGREDIQSGQVDRRVLAALSYLSARGYRQTVTSLKCGHSVYTSGGNVSAHSFGGAVDVAQLNGLPVLGNQGPGSITEAYVRDLLELQGTMTPSQIITLMDFGGPSFAMGDHADHVHIGYSAEGTSSDQRQFVQLLEPDQWERLIDRLGEIDNPEVLLKPSEYSIPTKKLKNQRGKNGRASSAHAGE